MAGVSYLIGIGIALQVAAQDVTAGFYECKEDIYVLGLACDASEGAN